MDEESDNFYRIASLLLDVGTITLREKLRCTFAPQSFHDFLRSKIHDISHLHNRGKCRHCKAKTELVIYKAQWDLLFQSSSTPCPVSGRLDDCYCSCIPSPHIDLDKLDITLISCLLLNTVNLDQPQKNLVKNLREARNEVFAHSPKAKLSEAEFGKYWTIATDNIDQIAATCGAQFVMQTRRNIEKIRSDVLDKEFCQKHLNIIQNSQLQSDAILKSLEASESKITGAVQDEGNMISAAVQEEGNKISDAVQGEGSKIMGAVKEEGSKIIDSVSEEGSKLAGVVKEEGGKIAGAVKEEGRKISGAVKAEGNKIMDAVKEEGNRISGAVKEEGSKIIDSVSEEGSKIAGVVKEEGGKIMGAVKEEGSKIMDTVKEEESKISDAVKEEGSRITSAVQEEGNKLKSAVKVNEDRITGAVQKEGNRIAIALQEEGHKIMSSVQLEGRSVADTVQEEGHRVRDMVKNVMEESIMGIINTRVQSQLQSIDPMIGQQFREDTEQSRALTEKERRRMEAIGINILNGEVN